MPPPVAESYDLGNATMMELVTRRLLDLGTARRARYPRGRPSPKDRSVIIEVVLDEAPLQTALAAFSWRIFGLSIVISLITAMLVFLTLQWLMVRPMRRITENMITFREDPEDANRVIQPTGRRDEIGTAQHELAGMQKRLRATLNQRPISRHSARRSPRSITICAVSSPPPCCCPTG